MHVRLGDWVEKGQKVITLQSEEVGNAKSEFYKSQADFELAKRNYERQKRLHRSRRRRSEGFHRRRGGVHRGPIQHGCGGEKAPHPWFFRRAGPRDRRIPSNQSHRRALCPHHGKDRGEQCSSGRYDRSIYRNPHRHELERSPGRHGNLREGYRQDSGGPCWSKFVCLLIPAKCS